MRQQGETQKGVPLLAAPECCACFGTQAAQSPAGSIERFLLVAAFAVSGYSSTAGRTVKPFNPLLGETYELVHAEKGFRAIVEKVHPLPLPLLYSAQRC